MRFGGLKMAEGKLYDGATAADKQNFSYVSLETRVTRGRIGGSEEGQGGQIYGADGAE